MLLTKEDISPFCSSQSDNATKKCLQQGGEGGGLKKICLQQAMETAENPFQQCIDKSFLKEHKTKM